MFIDKLAFYPMVDAKEALALADQRTIEDFDLIEEIAREYAKQEKCSCGNAEIDYKWYSICLYHTIFNAGRVQGIREERAKRRREYPTEQRRETKVN